MTSLRAQYGPWALIAGASVGLGAAFARALAAEGIHLILLARRPDALEHLGAELAAKHGIEVRVLSGDLGRPDLLEAVAEVVDQREVGMLIYNAAHSVRGPFLDQPLAEQLRVIDVNCRGPLALSHLLGQGMVRRGRGALILMTSIAGSQGNPLLASYAASKAFNLVFAEGLWAELRARGVRVLAVRAGATRTPGYAASQPRGAVPLMEPEAVVACALRALERGPSVTPGWLNRLASFLFGRLLSRRAAIRLMGKATARLYG